MSRSGSQNGSPNGVEAVVFDWGGTLSTWVEIEMEDMWHLAARHLDPVNAEALCRRLGEIELATFARTETDQRSSTLSDILRTASDELGMDVGEAVLEEAATHYLDTWTPHIVHEPDAVDALQALRERGLRLALLSNTHWPRAFHEHFLERDGLAELLDVRLYTSELEFMKPHPSVYRGALDALGIDDPGGAVFVGDRLFDDVFGAKRAGLRGVWRRAATPAYDVEPDAVIDTLSELPAIVDGWRA